MEKYKNLSGESNITSYLIDENSITILFNDGGFYLYSTMKVGLANMNQMKKLALQGHGLNGFINKNVRKLFDKKWR